MTREIRNSAHKLVGKIITEGSTTIVVTDASNKKLGFYRFSDNATYDAGNRKIGNGDLTMSLLNF